MSDNGQSLDEALRADVSGIASRSTPEARSLLAESGVARNAFIPRTSSPESSAKTDKPADIKTIRGLHQDELLSDQAFDAAMRILRPASSWYTWAERNLLFFGSALVLAGIIFFFAYNWSVMGKFLKFGLIEAGIAACAIGSYFLGLNRLTGKLLLLSASILLGVLMAVYGQTYQTGADAFELFTGWAALIFGWVVVSEFAALWLTWLVLVNTGAILYWMQVLEPCHSVTFEYLCMGLALIDGAALALRELGAKQGMDWLSGKWLRGILLLAVLAALAVPTIVLIIDFGDASKVTGIIAISWILVSAGGYACYRFIFRDMASLAIIVTNLCAVLLTFTGKLMLDSNHYYGSGEAFMFLFFALIIIAVVSAAAFWLKKTAAKMAKETAK